MKHAVTLLAEKDADLANILGAYGPPPLWDRQPGFPTLVHIILEQQVSLASARAAFDKLNAAASPLTPQAFLAFNDKQLKAFGFSRQKATYCRHLAQAILEKQFAPEKLENLPDEEVRAALLQLKGIGNWTADIYLLMVLCRPDIWPHGDLALAQAVRRAKLLDHLPTTEEMKEIAEDWKPYRAAAARMLWHFYLSDGFRKLK